MNEYPNWVQGSTPNTNYKAKITHKRYVSEAKAIEVVGAKYRGATLDGVFELVDTDIAKLPGRILVRCAWFGVTPPTTYPQLDISSAKVTKLPKYTGLVAHNIST